MEKHINNITESNEMTAQEESKLAHARAIQSIDRLPLPQHEADQAHKRALESVNAQKCSRDFLTTKND